MASLDMVMYTVSCVQPLAIGLIIWWGLGAWVGSLADKAALGAPRTRPSSLRMFECSSNGRLTSRVSISLNSLGVCLAFVLYDIDLFFFFAETAHLSSSSPTELIFLAFYYVLFCGGLWYDYHKFGFEWAH
jgi:NADH:ubiquinone oxidoreductase subunit 3 (subunit A)